MFYRANYRLMCSCLYTSHFTLKRRLHVMYTLIHICFDHSLELTVRAGLFLGQLQIDSESRIAATETIVQCKVEVLL